MQVNYVHKHYQLLHNFIYASGTITGAVVEVLFKAKLQQEGREMQFIAMAYFIHISKLHTYFLSESIIYTPTWSGGFFEMMSEPLVLSASSSVQLFSLLAMSKSHTFILHT